MIVRGHDTIADVLSFLADLWRSARRPAIARRCARIAIAVGTLLSLVNQGDALVAGRPSVATVLRILANYLIPFVVSNLGAMSSLPPRQASLPGPEASPPPASPPPHEDSPLPRQR